MEIFLKKFKDTIVAIEKDGKTVLFSLEADNKFFYFDDFESEIIKAYFKHNDWNSALDQLAKKNNYNPEELKSFTLKLIDMLEEYELFQNTSHK